MALCLLSVLTGEPSNTVDRLDPRSEPRSPASSSANQIPYNNCALLFSSLARHRNHVIITRLETCCSDPAEQNRRRAGEVAERSATWTSNLTLCPKRVRIQSSPAYERFVSLVDLTTALVFSGGFMSSLYCFLPLYFPLPVFVGSILPACSPT